MKSRILFFPNSKTYLHQYKLIFENNIFKNEFTPVIFCSNDLKVTSKFNKLEKIKFRKFNSLTDKLNFFNNFLSDILKLLIYTCEVFIFKKHIIRCLKKQNIELVIIPGDRELPPTPFIINFFQEKKIPIIIFNNNNIVEKKGQLMKRKNIDFTCYPIKKVKILNYFVSKIFKQYVVNHEKKKFLFTPGWKILSLKLIGIEYKNPWLIGGSSNSFITVNDEKHKNDFIKSGISEERMIDLGDFEEDAVFRSLQNREKKRKEISDSNKPLILFAIPNDFEEDVLSWDEHCRRIKKLVEIMLKKPYEIFFSLHPKSEKKKYFSDIRILSKINYLEKNMSEYFACFDIFVCSLSSTLKWSKKLGLKTININFLELNIPSLKGPSILESKNFFQFERQFNFFLKKLKYQKDKLPLKQLKYFDGKSYERFFKKFKEIKGIKNI